MMLLLVIGSIFAGHAALWIMAINRVHAWAWPRPVLKLVDGLWYLAFLGVPAAYTAGWLGSLDHGVHRPTPWDPIPTVYSIVCWVALAAGVATWIRYLRHGQSADQLAANHTTRHRLGTVLGHRCAGSLATVLASRLPGNQVFELDEHEKTLLVPRLPRALNGLSIAHLSDLHFTGQVARAYFEEVVRLTNQLDADLIAISGDIIDKRCCFSWLHEVLGRLKARHGVYFVLGNHDLRIRDQQRLRRTLVDAGMVDLGGQVVVLRIDQHPILLAGNEAPWYRSVPDVGQLSQEPDSSRPLRILVTHTPDQLPWARQHDFDLVLAGHTHGGQVRLPLVGPVFCPSRHGVKYACGVFYREPTLMHVSRGISGTRPVRINCPPELAKLVLQRVHSDG